ncbi:inositol 2-dehydrogenase [Enterovibrio paralichthyis]|uniref:inositol 2-dehydrogenase n=1 Tax=Enterovibrio paralichthyis TaxID=2853805 RepID=UPI001C478D16|nr:inositol 2-dehydrogenase [Enterovibrio paralichthyis]MBV7298344.1 inositol 2-dehydrogenase [Enterovibrio paralichthyis]
MLNISIIGAGRMGDIYAPIIAQRPDTRIRFIASRSLASAKKLTDQYGGTPSDNIAAAIADNETDAVIICSPTTTHLEYITLAARAGKPILCEKPVDLNVGRVLACQVVLDEHPVLFGVGFNRRFDPAIDQLKRRVQQGDIGKLNMLLLTSRDPAPPPLEYLKKSGGYFCDSTIHDIDLACWISGETPFEVYTAASCMVDPAIGELGDADTAMTTLRMPSGLLVHINNSRRAVYGFDQRIEAFGDKGMLQTLNHTEHTLQQFSADATHSQPPLQHFFLERYAESFRREVDDFIHAITQNSTTSAGLSDGLLALKIAQTCQASFELGKSLPFDA